MEDLNYSVKEFEEIQEETIIIKISEEKDIWRENEEYLRLKFKVNLCNKNNYFSRFELSYLHDYNIYSIDSEEETFFCDFKNMKNINHLKNHILNICSKDNFVEYMSRKMGRKKVFYKQNYVENITKKIDDDFNSGKMNISKYKEIKNKIILKMRDDADTIDDIYDIIFDNSDVFNDCDISMPQKETDRFLIFIIKKHLKKCITETMNIK